MVELGGYDDIRNKGLGDNIFVSTRPNCNERAIVELSVCLLNN